MATSVAAENTVDDRFALIANALKGLPEFSSKEVPGLESLIDDYLSHDVEVDRFDFMRRLLQVFRESKTDNTYQNLLERCTKHEKEHLESFVHGTRLKDAAKGFHDHDSLSVGRKLLHTLAETAESLLEILDINDDKSHITVKENLEFQNWGRSVKNTPKYTFVPKTVADVQQIVRLAKESHLSVRCSGYRHSWSPIFGETGQILISLLPIARVTTLPDATSLPLPELPPTELEEIVLLPEKLPGGKRLVSVGCSTTLERLRRWCVKTKLVTIPMNIVMVEITCGGANGPICHGAGKRHKTMSDIVRGIEYVDAHGVVRYITSKDDDFLLAASGCFGLIGVITRLTLEFDPMTYAEMRPAKVPMIQAVPPPPDMPYDRIPPALRPKKPFTDEEKLRFQREFEEKANNDYYSEWFWFPYADNCWINCWNNTTDASDVEDWPDPINRFVQWIETFTLNMIQDCDILNKLIEKTHLAEAAVTLQSHFAMLVLPEVKKGEKSIKTYVSDALHFQRGTQNVRVRDLEVELPLTPKKSDPSKVDYTTVQRAWWDAILKAYEHSDTCPQRMPLEMRMVSDSNVVMAPQKGNTMGTCAIEILTLQNAVNIWEDYAQEVLDLWMSYTDADGKRLKTRPHWAKEWYNYKVDGKPWLDKLKTEDYADEIKEFKDILSRIGKAHGWTLVDLKKRFSNQLYNKLIFDDVEMKNGY